MLGVCEFGEISRMWRMLTADLDALHASEFGLLGVFETKTFLDVGAKT